MKLITALHDIARYLTLTPAMQRVRLSPAEDKCYMDAIFGRGTRDLVGCSLQGAYDPQGDQKRDPAAVVVLEPQSSFSESIDGLEFPIGIPSPQLVAAVLKHPDYSSAKATIVKGKHGLASLMLKGANDSVQAIALDTGSALGRYTQRLPFKQIQCDIEFTPTETTINNLAHWMRRAKEHYAEDAPLTISTRNNKVIGRFSDGSQQYVDFCLSGFFLAKRVDGVLLPHFSYDTATVLRLLKLHETADVSARVYSEGALEIRVKSENAFYRFVHLGTRIHEVSTYLDLNSAMEIDFAEQKLREIAMANADPSDRDGHD